MTNGVSNDSVRCEVHACVDPKHDSINVPKNDQDPPSRNAGGGGAAGDGGGAAAGGGTTGGGSTTGGGAANGGSPAGNNGGATGNGGTPPVDEKYNPDRAEIRERSTQELDKATADAAGYHGDMGDDPNATRVGAFGGPDNPDNPNPNSKAVFVFNKDKGYYEVAGEMWYENGNPTYHEYNDEQKKKVNVDHAKPGSLEVWPDNPV